jgi:hypothetical protein
MLTTNGFHEEPRRAEGSARRRAARAAAAEARWRRRRVLRDLFDMAESCLLGTSVMIVLAFATLLLIRTLAR